MWEKRCKHCAEIVLNACSKPLLSQQYYFKPLANKRTNNKIVDKTFEEIELHGFFSKFLVILDILNRILIERAMQKNRNFSKCIVTQVVCWHSLMIYHHACLSISFLNLSFDWSRVYIYGLYLFYLQILTHFGFDCQFYR